MTDLVLVAAAALPGDPACTTGPCLDIGPVPDPTSREHGYRLGEVSPARELVDALVSDAEDLGDLRCAHELLLQLQRT
jgi:hypothetical protein